MQKVNVQYKTNLQKLENFVMIKFTEDTMVVPKESEVRLQKSCIEGRVYGISYILFVSSEATHVMKTILIHKVRVISYVGI